MGTPGQAQHGGAPILPALLRLSRDLLSDEANIQTRKTRQGKKMRLIKQLETRVPLSAFGALWFVLLCFKIAVIL